MSEDGSCLIENRKMYKLFKYWQVLRRRVVCSVGESCLQSYIEVLRYRGTRQQSLTICHNHRSVPCHEP